MPFRQLHFQYSWFAIGLFEKSILQWRERRTGFTSTFSRPIFQKGQLHLRRYQGRLLHFLQYWLPFVQVRTGRFICQDLFGFEFCWINAQSNEFSGSAQRLQTIWRTNYWSGMWQKFLISILILNHPNSSYYNSILKHVDLLSGQNLTILVYRLLPAYFFRKPKTIIFYQLLQLLD